MTPQRDPDRLIASFLTEGNDELSERAFERVRRDIEQTRQRVVLGPWKEPRMFTLARIGIAAAAVIAVVAVGLNLRSDDGGIGAGATPPASASPSPSPVASPIPLPVSGDLAPGTYVISAASYTVAPLSLTVPEGWTTGEGMIHKNYVFGQHRDHPDAVVLGTWLPSHVYGDACRWEGTLVDAGTTVDDLVTALADQGSRVVRGPDDTTLGGYPAKRMELSLPPSLDETACDRGVARTWPDPGPDESGGWPVTTGQTDVVYVVDVEGDRLAVVLAWQSDASDRDVAELEAIAESIRFEP